MKKIIILLSFFLIIYTPHIVHGEEAHNIIDETLDLPSVSGFNTSETAKEAAEGKINITFSSVFDKLTEFFLENLRENYKVIIKMASVALISGILVNFSDSKNDTGRIVCVATVGILSLGTFTYAVNSAKETCDTLFIFVEALIPSVATASIAMGHTAGSATCGVVFCAMQIFIHICKEVILPFISVITALTMVDNLSETRYLKGVNAFLKKMLSWGTGLLLTLYGGVVALQTQTAGAFDSLAGKTVKYAVGNFVPIVGGALSDSLEMVMQSAKVIKSALGISGILGVCYICAGPLINICSVALAYKIAAAISSVSADKKVSEVINEIGGGIGKICINVTAVAVMFILSLSMLCRFGGGI